MKALQQHICAMAMLSLLLPLAGCGSRSSAPSVLTVTIGGRTIQATVDGGGFISSENDAAMIACGAGKIRVEKDRVLLGDKELTKIPAEAAKIDIVYARDAVVVSADGAQVYPPPARK